MSRDLVINLVLILLGIVLAIALFSAGALWKSRVGNKNSSGLSPLRTGGNGNPQQSISAEVAIACSSDNFPTCFSWPSHLLS